MQNIVTYFNTFLNVIFDGGIILYSPSAIISYLGSINYTQGLESYIVNVLHHPEYFFSYFVWGWFSVLSVNLLIIFPYKWIRSVIRKCKI